MEYIYAFSKSDKDLNQFIASIDFANNTYMLLETYTDVLFDLYKPTDFTVWNQGRIFNRVKEIKWRQVGDMYKVVLISDEDGLTGFKQRLCLKHEQPPPDITRQDERVVHLVEEEVYLWGMEAQSKSSDGYEFAANQFIERPIPRILEYPVKADNKDCRVVVRIQKYLSLDGNLAFYRFKEVITK